MTKRHEIYLVMVGSLFLIVFFGWGLWTLPSVNPDADRVVYLWAWTNLGFGVVGLIMGPVVIRRQNYLARKYNSFNFLDEPSGLSLVLDYLCDRPY